MYSTPGAVVWVRDPTPRHWNMEVQEWALQGVEYIKGGLTVLFKKFTAGAPGWLSGLNI